MSSPGWQATACHHHVAARAELHRRLAHRPVLGLERPDDRRRRAGARQPFALGAPRQALHLGRIAGHAHVLAVGELPAMQRVLLHGGDDEIAVRRKGDRRYARRPIPARPACRRRPGNAASRHCSGRRRSACLSARRRGLRPSAGAGTPSPCRRRSGHRPCGRRRRRSRLAAPARRWSPICGRGRRACSTLPSAAIAATLPSSPPVISRGVGGVERRRSAGRHAPRAVLWPWSSR